MNNLTNSQSSRVSNFKLGDQGIYLILTQTSFSPSFFFLVMIYLVVMTYDCVAVTYLENNRAGLTVFGFMLDRTWLHSIFVIQLALLLWLLNKTVGIS